MILRRIHIDNFGEFHDFDLELVPGFNEIIRPNEGGKSTLLEFIRRIFWGFPDGRSNLNAYPALNGSGLYGGFLEVTLSNGEELTLERRGLKAPLKLRSADGSVTEVPDVSNLTNCSRQFYCTVGAITIDELHEFSNLDDAEIRNRLYGGMLTAGVKSISVLKKELKDRADELFKPRGAKNRLKQLAFEFETSDKRVAEAASRLDAYQQALRNAEKLEESDRKTVAELALAEEHLKKLVCQQKGFSDFQNLKLAESKFKDLPAIAAPEKPEMPETLRGKCEAERAGCVNAEAEIEASALLQKERGLRSALEECSAQIQAIVPVPEVPPAPVEPKAPAELSLSCDPFRAAAVTENDLETVSLLMEKFQQEKLCREKYSSLFWPQWGNFALAVLLLLPGLIHKFLWMAAAGVFFVCILLFFTVKRGRLKKAGAAVHQELQKQLADLQFRFALNPALSPEKLGETLMQVKAFQQDVAAYAEAAKRHEVAKAEREKEVSRREQHRTALLQKRDECNEGLRELALKVAEFRFRFALVSQLPAEEIPEILKMLALFQLKLREFDLRQKEFEKLLAERKKEEQKLVLLRETLLKEYGAEPEELPAGAVESAVEELEKLKALHASNLKNSGAARFEAKQLEKASDSADELNTREQIRGEMMECAREYLKYQAAYRLIERAVARGEREHQGEVIKEAEQLFSSFTGGRYTKLYKELESGELRTLDSSNSLLKGVGQLSRGTREQLCLALRLALIVSFDKENEALPIVLDDVLVNFDTIRRQAVLNALHTFAQGRQLLLLEVKRD